MLTAVHRSGFPAGAGLVCGVSRDQGAETPKNSLCAALAQMQALLLPNPLQAQLVSTGDSRSLTSDPGKSLVML